ncbi:MAG: hypothetical protein IJV70_07585 [Clostridia bacterium]|nr:hypothetical protein [Clostridia bacterium]
MKSKNQKTPQNSSVRGMIIKKGESYYTDLYKLLDALDGIHLNYKWLVSYPECSAFTKETQALFEKEYCIISGDELTESQKTLISLSGERFPLLLPTPLMRKY